MSKTVTLYCIWPKCDEHCHAQSETLVCPRHFKKVRAAALPTPSEKDKDDAGAA